MTDRPAPLPLAPLPRFLGEFGGLLAVLLGSPGFLSANGLPLLAAVGLGLWGALAVRPLGERRWRARLGEFVAGGVTIGATLWWSWHVWPPTVLYMFVGMGCYTLAACGLLRALERRVPLVVAVPLTWTAIEVLRSAIPPPLGIGWLRLGHAAHHHLWFSGSARVWGVEGIGFALAALGGLVAAVIATRRLGGRDALLGLGPALLAVILSLVVSPPETKPGPRLLIVQPGFSQARKQTFDPNENFRELLAQTHDALAELEATGTAPPDLVCWGESMLFLPLFAAGVTEALEDGVQLPPWEEPLDAATVAGWNDVERSWVHGMLFGRGLPPSSGYPRLPAGTSFLTGAEVYGVVGDQIRRRNAVVLYDAAGHRGPAAGKRYLVPGAESMLGLERWDFVRRSIDEIAGYVPDLAADDVTGVLELVTRDGRRYRMGATVCFDNAFLPPYTEAVAGEGGVDFHVVASNEAWYLESCEVDQMVAFSRLIALSTGRAVVRATNSGISVGIDPDGTERGRIREGDRDRLVRGTMLLEVPVPAAGPAGSVPPYVRLRLLLRVLLATVPLALLAWFRVAGGNPSPPGG